MLSVKGVTRGHLLGDKSSLDMTAKLSDEDAATLEACGWNPEEGIKRLLNFSGDSHQLCTRQSQSMPMRCRIRSLHDMLAGPAPFWS